MAGGRPTKYKAEFAKAAAKLCELGATDMELADAFDVDVATVYRWKITHPQFCEAVKCGAAAADDRVERAFYNRAVGYTHETVKIFMPSGADAPVYAPYREHVPPDVGAAFNWLKNRRGEVWREKRDDAATGEVHVHIHKLAD